MKHTTRHPATSTTIATLLSCLALAGCANSTAIPLQHDTVQIKASAAIACGPEGAARVAYQNAAKQTLLHGYDKFMIINAAHTNTIRMIARTPVQTNTSISGVYSGNTIYGGGFANTTGHLSGSARSTTTGGTPIYGGSYKQDYVVKMFKETDPHGSNALSARHILGADWQTKMNEKTNTCL